MSFLPVDFKKKKKSYKAMADFELSPRPNPYMPGFSTNRKLFPQYPV